MPGTVVSVSVGEGEHVVTGQVLLSVEAMKMEHQLLAPLAGTVHLGVGTGDLVKVDQVLATIHPDPDPEPDTELHHAPGQTHHDPIITGKGA
jgi:acetyl-CoA/propionyl-CoA carboxylase biotin carboxyl carrier protein